MPEAIEQRYRCPEGHQWVIRAESGGLPPAVMACPLCPQPEADSKFAVFQRRELERARSKWPGKITSVHAAYGIILEELDEFWDEVRLPQPERVEARIMEELLQVAAMAQRAAEDLGLEGFYRPG